ncbi:hypothetical protein DFJ63DRAFT_314029 [Scheffersomyces coipomensis]|uniref:uncharacterized protein n=1 Tax=Scheffersomyces coipomensis TaxID=1788519 RepID=UPI00315C6CC5
MSVYSPTFYDYQGATEKGFEYYDEVAFHNLNGLLFTAIDEPRQKHDTISPEVDIVIITFLKISFQLGYYISDDIVNTLTSMKNRSDIINHCKKFMNVMKDTKGVKAADGIVFYKTFPEHVMKASDAELFVNAIAHYWTWGTLLPSYVKKERLDLNELLKMKTIKNVITKKDLINYFLKLLCSKSAPTPAAMDFIDQGLENKWYNEIPADFDIPFKELLTKVATFALNNGLSINKYVKSCTDILRIMAHLSDQDITLQKKIKFKSLPRKQRRIIVNSLERVIKVEDIKPYSGLWKLAFHNLHVGELKRTKVCAIAKQFRNTNNVPTLDTKYCEAIKKKQSIIAMNSLKVKPPIFARLLDKLIRDCYENDEELIMILQQFTISSKKINPKILLQALGHFQRRKYLLNNPRDNKHSQRLIYTSGSTAATLIFPNHKTILPHEVLDRIIIIIQDSLIEQFKTKQLLKHKKVYIPSVANGLLLPIQLSGTSTKKTIARASKFPLLDQDEVDKHKKTFVRFFTHWIGRIIDTSILFVSEEGKAIDLISWHHLRTDYAWHSGDVVNAPPPNGATEYIDVDIKKCLESGCRYLMMDIRSWNGPTFAKHDECFSGIMMRENNEAGQHFEPSTVKYKFDLVGDTHTTIACVVDLKTMDLIWIDAAIKFKSLYNNLIDNLDTMLPAMREYSLMHKYKVSMGQLIRLHLEGSEGAQLVDKREDADYIVSLEDDGDLNLYDFAEINSNWI